MIFTALVFLIVGFILVVLVAAALLMVTGWKSIYPGWCALSVFVLATMVYGHRYSLNWHSLLRPTLLAVLLYAAMQIGIAIIDRLPKRDTDGLF